MSFQRKFGQSLVLIAPNGDKVTLNFTRPTDIQRRADVRICIEAPKDMKIWRAEIEPTEGRT